MFKTGYITLDYYRSYFHMWPKANYTTRHIFLPPPGQPDSMWPLETWHLHNKRALWVGGGDTYRSRSHLCRWRSPAWCHRVVWGLYTEWSYIGTPIPGNLEKTRYHCSVSLTPGRRVGVKLARRKIQLAYIPRGGDAASLTVSGQWESRCNILSVKGQI